MPCKERVTTFLAEKPIRLMLAAALLFLLFLGASSLPLFTGAAEFTGDDYYYVVNNPRVNQPGLAPLAEIWRRPMKIEYFPVTITGYALQYRLWGNSVKPYHLTSILVFCGIGLVTFSLARRLAGGVAIPLLATLAMLCHPINVEAVASVSNCKELLYVFFGLLMLRLYMAFPRRPATLAGAFCCLVLAQLSKGSGVVLPLLLLIYELFREQEPDEKRRRLVHLVPFFAVAVAAFVVQFQVALKAGVVEKSAQLTPLARIGGCVRSFNTMLAKFLLPVNLSFDYDLPWPPGLPPVSEWILPLLVLAVLSFLAITGRRRLLMLLLMALVPLLPYLNLVPLRHNVSGQMVFYDHYLLFSTMVGSLLLTQLLSKVGERWPLAAAGGLLVAIIAFVAADWRFYGFWQTRETLYRRVIAMAPDLPRGYLFLGQLYNEQARYEEAREVLGRIRGTRNWLPMFVKAYLELGNANAFSGHFAEAEVAYRNYLQYYPKERSALQNLASSLIEQRKFSEAREAILQWLMYYPNDADAIHNLQLIGGKN